MRKVTRNYRKKDDVTLRRKAPSVVTYGQYLMEITPDHNVPKETYLINVSDAFHEQTFSTDFAT